MLFWSVYWFICLSVHLLTRITTNEPLNL
jgi:hypothetical protein